MKLGTLVGSLVVLGTACSVVPEETGERARQSAEGPTTAERSDTDVATSFFSMSHDVCDAGTVASGRACGTSLCARGEYCCNESCGICAPRGAVCIQIQCGPASEPLTKCAVDADCRTASSYCDGCQCLAVGALEPDPSCHATIVACFVDPCLNKQSACINGFCSLDG